MGKTTMCVDLITGTFASQVDRVVVVCPTFYDQDMFRAIDPLIRNPHKDVFLKPTKATFKMILDQLRCFKATNKKDGKRVKNLLFVDDLAGNPVIHGTMSSFGELCIQSPHLDLTMICISQQFTAISPSFRKNISSLMVFPSTDEDEMKIIQRKYTSINHPKDCMKEMMQRAWLGHDNKPNHFFFIFMTPRQELRYFSDFKFELFPHS
jgi:hypothetical protein